jgi:hypothetical protein
MATEKKGKVVIKWKFSKKGGFCVHQTKYISLNLHKVVGSDVRL